MGNRNIDVEKNKLSFQEITGSDTISKFMEKVNSNFNEIIKNNGGPIGTQGVKGEQGVPTKPKVPIHVWKKGVEYIKETKFEIPSKIENEDNIKVDLKNAKYQEGHLILLENAHVYILEVDNTDSNFSLKPKFLIALQLSYNQDGVTFGDSIFKISENEIEMSVKNCGLKITKEGIYIKKSNKEWFELNVK